MFVQVASYMRAVLRTLAQCHTHCILHRDVKPGAALPMHCFDRSPVLESFVQLVCCSHAHGQQFSECV